MIDLLRVSGLFAGMQLGKEEKTGLTFQKVTIIFEGGKKHNFKAYGTCLGFEALTFGALITADVDTPTLTNFGEFSSHGDCSWKCAEMRLLSPRPTAEQKK